MEFDRFISDMNQNQLLNGGQIDIFTYVYINFIFIKGLIPIFIFHSHEKKSAFKGPIFCPDSSEAASYD